MEEKMSQILYGINEEAAKYYYAMLRSDRGKAGIDCLKRLSLTDETIDRFRLGYTGEGKSGLVEHLKDKGYLDDQIIEAGLAILTIHNSVEDTFRDRIIIPIMDDEYRVIGFSGRLIDRGSPKYLIPRETLVFDKRRSLFGLDHAKDSTAQYIILSEGFFDVIMLHQAGYDMAVAPLLGTRFNLDHAVILKKYAQEVIICYDSDEFGSKEAEKVIAILGQSGIKAKRVDLSPYQDVFEYITKEGGKAFGEMLRTVLE